ncbi:2-phosphosulfolactate phosphatase [Paenibacillus sp. CF384]|uniref:2-phosphosulfolactate phosphatase n=1 Tax=Paenibacillus sp. CF384 TaxID=1884382 RepID=UPI00089C0F87|nr:2-phosphosulfolactate phosphatase [Paenibacillus sp. CF384]SDW61450.1 2-phosphosulfolactate phosphatase [Paenibacillus sp. CF384]
MTISAVYQQINHSARFEWGYDGVRALAPVSDLVVIIDVLSFTTCVDIVLSREGVVFPYRFKDASAADYASEKNALLAGKRSEPISLSPARLALLETNSRIVLPSPNGATCSFIAKDSHCEVIAACLRNASAVARYIRERGGIVTVIAAGERWSDGSLRPSFEDMLAAGAILSQLGAFELSPEAKSAAAVFESCKGELAQMVAACSSGQELLAAGYEDDIQLATELDSSLIIPVLDKHGAFVNRSTSPRI